MTDYDSIINQYSNWYAEFLKYRDTAAHRFPIYIPPNVLTNYEEEAEYKRLEKKLENDFMSRGDFTTATNYRIRKKMIGSFKPYGFINKHNEFFKIRPKINHDMSQFLSISINILVSLISYSRSD